MNAPAMHAEVAPAAEQTCGKCGILFKPKRGWATFCSARCRNDHHTIERRKDAIRARALRMFDTLASLALVEGPVGSQARAAIEGLKAPDAPISRRSDG